MKLMHVVYYTCAICMFIMFGVSILLQLVSDMKCEGEWGKGHKQENMTGNGQCIWRFGVISTLSNSSLFMRETAYEGSWLLGRKHGHGKYRSFSGINHEGYWFDNKREGQGVLTINERTKYTGVWIDDVLTCDNAVLSLSCNNKCKQYSTELFSGTVTYKGPVKEGLFDGVGVISFSDSNRKIHTRFDNGRVKAVNGVFTLQDGTLISIEKLEDKWDFLTYTSEGLFKYLPSTNNAIFYEWNGETLTDKSTGAQISEKNRNSSDDTVGVKQGVELISLLDSLKWLELHFIKSQLMLQSEVYSFEAPPPQQLDDVSKGKEGELKEAQKEVPSEVKKEEL